MFRVTRKQLIRQNGNVIEFEDSRVVQTIEDTATLQYSIRNDELALGGQPYGPSKVIFETTFFYRSVTVAIEEIN